MGEERKEEENFVNSCSLNDLDRTFTLKDLMGTERFYESNTILLQTLSFLNAFQRAWLLFIVTHTSYLGFLLILKDGTLGSRWRGWKGLVIGKNRIQLDNTWKRTRTPISLTCQQLPLSILTMYIDVSMEYRPALTQSTLNDT